jgi:hypothetical protein
MSRALDIVERVAVLAVVAVLCVACWLLSRSAEREHALRLVEEGNRIAAEGFALENVLSERELTARAERAIAADELARALAAAPGARVVRVVEASTGPIAAGGEALPTVECRAAEPCPPCLLAPGNPTEVRVAEVTIAYREGSRVALGAAAVWRLAPGPETRIASGPWSAPATDAAGEAPPSHDVGRWAFGVGALASSHGLAPGVAVAAPPLRILGQSFDLVLGAGVGPGGAQGSAALLWRPGR